MPKRTKLPNNFVVADSVTGKSYDHTTGKNFDPTSGATDLAKVLGPKGEVVSEVGKKRIELLDTMMTEIQTSIQAKLSGINLSGKVDNVENSLFEMQAYGDSLKSAIAIILQDYPTGDSSDELLGEMKDLCEVLSEGVSRATYYLEEIKRFADDVKGIQNQIYSRMASIRFELP
jgi:hypothetical protein